ncbi:MAG: formylglycine-generating enzyme family protein [Rhodospirillales bacterium]|nr:formylglycine-generating enzyme family protein [Rhodospirillales bacterium]
MNFKTFFTVIGILGLCWFLPSVANAQRTSSLDLITMQNGDFHHGTVAQESFTLKTPYGIIQIPYGQIKYLKVSSNQDIADFLVTINGARHSGKFVTEKFFTMRPQQPSLTVQVVDVAEIEFGQKTLPRTKQTYQDAIELGNGDSFPTSITPTELMVKTTKGLATVKTKATYIADIIPREDDETTQVSLTLNSFGKTVRGTLLNRSLSAEIMGGQFVTIPTNLIRTAAFNIRSLETDGRTGLHFALRKRVNPALLIQDTLEDGSKAPETLILRGGSFTRGGDSPENDFDEKPSQEINLPKPFAIGLYEVTFKEYDRFCEATDREKPDDGGWGRNRHPVINVSWEEAVEYTKWLSEKTGQTYRLPTDAEWEYAAKGGTTTKFWWGDNVGTANANCAQCGSIWEAERTSRVGKFPPNPFGLHDTAGNVFEWVADCFHSSFAEAPSDGKALEKEKGCGQRVIRGGGWSFPPKESRSANRWRDFPTGRSEDTGFRVVRELRD